MVSISMTKLYLIPTTLANPIESHALLNSQLEQIQHLHYFIVETAKIGRQHIKQLGLNEALQTLSITELNKHQENLQELIQPLLDGNDVGLMSDCGLPAIADPGSKIVRLAHQHNIEVVPLIGPSSLLLALMSSGVNGQSFAFNGYIPIDKDERINKIRQLQKLIKEFSQSQIIIETPFRNIQLFEQLISTLSDDIILSLATNLMSLEQKILSHSIKEWKTLANLPDIHKQEVVFVIGM